MPTAAAAPRLNIQPDERFIPLRPALQERLRQVGATLTPENFAGICEGLVEAVLHEGISRAGAHEGSVWLVDREQQNLVIALNTGPRRAELVGTIRQPLTEGIVSMVVASEQSFVENEVFKNSEHSKRVDRALGQVTQAMVVVPFYLLGECRGVLSAVQVMNPNSGEPPPLGFDRGSLAAIQRLAQVITDLLDYRLLRLTVGWGGGH